MNLEDIFLWPNGDWCFREDAAGMLKTHSDDYEVIPYQSGAWHDLVTWA